MEYRFATAADVPALAAMNWQLIRDEGHRNRMTLPELESRMAEWIAGEYRAVLFEDTREAVGYALFRPEPEYVYLRQLFVRPEHRRRGVGRDALAWLRRHAWADAPRVRIDVLVGNAGAFAFWRAVGFRDYCLTMEWECNAELPPTT
ncbi:MAG TPA: GNAT family N-acetyltransferase [Gemmataceae bacterium]|nr:GNAT family N-acetyltransferase [Gemmataceae bacterium]